MLCGEQSIVSEGFWVCPVGFKASTLPFNSIRPSY